MKRNQMRLGTARKCTAICGINAEVPTHHRWEPTIKVRREVEGASYTGKQDLPGVDAPSIYSRSLVTVSRSLHHGWVQ